VKLATIEFVDDDMLGFKIELTDFWINYLKKW
jgi:hypothetical protein